VEGYRSACAARGIDPAEGATGYQVVHVLAERQRRRWEAQGRSEQRWWMRHELWFDCEPYRSETEADAIWRLFAQAYDLTAQVLIRTARLHRAALAALPLWEVFQGKGSGD
jgi:hypothetical protein